MHLARVGSGNRHQGCGLVFSGPPQRVGHVAVGDGKASALDRPLELLGDRCKPWSPGGQGLRHARRGE